MTAPALLMVGDEVAITFEPRSHLHQQFPDGAVGIVGTVPQKVICISRLSKGPNPPGVYCFKDEDISVWLPNGRVVSGFSTINMVNEDEERRRYATFCDENGVFQEPFVRLGDFPETEFWELDKVVIVSQAGVGGVTVAVVTDINTHHMLQYGSGGTKDLYTFCKRSDLVAGGWEYTNPYYGDQVVLTERGSLWQYCHGESTKSLDEIREELCSINRAQIFKYSSYSVAYEEE